jgi:CBS domain-containing protein
VSGSTREETTVKTAEDMMQKGVVSVSPELPLEDFEELLTAEDVSGAPVTDVNGKLVGIASKTDIVRGLSEQMSSSLREMNGAGLTVADVMTEDVVTVAPDDSMESVARKMVDGSLHRVLVTEDDEVVGIITSLDVLRVIA